MPCKLIWTTLWCILCNFMWAFLVCEINHIGLQNLYCMFLSENDIFPPTVQPVQTSSLQVSLWTLEALAFFHGGDNVAADNGLMNGCQRTDRHTDILTWHSDTLHLDTASYPCTGIPVGSINFRKGEWAMKVPQCTPGAKAASSHRCMFSMNLTTWLSNDLLVQMKLCTSVFKYIQGGPKK